MSTASLLYKYILGTGVVGGVAAGIILGGMKCREALHERNSNMDANYNAMDGNQTCPLSDNFERVLQSKRNEHLEANFPMKDIGSRIAH